MFAVTDIKQVPWYAVNAESKKCARLKVMRHLLAMITWCYPTPESLQLPPAR